MFYYGLVNPDETSQQFLINSTTTAEKKRFLKGA